MVVPDHRRQSEVITQGIGELTPGELEIIHKVVNALEPPAEGEINTANDVVKMNPGIDVIAVLANRLPSSTADVRRDIFVRTCLLYTSPSPRDYAASRMPSSA